MNILIIEDDPDVGETVSMAFSMRWQDANVQVADTGGNGLDAIDNNKIDLVILDVNLPDMDGFQVPESIREKSQVPVIMFTVRAADAEKVRGLEMGADDYLARPFSPFELLARAAAVLRRASAGGGAERDVMQAGVITVNQGTAEVFVDQEAVKLSTTEFKILSMLVQNAGRVVSRDTLISEIWGIDPGAADSYLIKLHIQHLRKKLGDTGTKPQYIFTVRGFGYRVLT